MGQVAEGDAVRIREGETLNHDNEHIVVDGMCGRVNDSEGYEQSESGKHMVGVKLDEEHGGGIAYVEEGRLDRGHGRRSFGGLGAAWDRIFGRRKAG